MHPDNRAIFDANWDQWVDLKIYGPGSRWLRWLVAQNLEYIRGSEIRSVVDVGCGEGTLTAMLAQLLPSARVLGIDFSEAGIRLANKSYGSSNLTFKLDPDSTHLIQTTYDLATCFEVLEHVDDWESLLLRICRASNRYVMLSYPTGRMRAFEVFVGHVRNFQKGQVEALMKRNDFVPRNLFYAGFPFFSPFYRDFQNLIDAGSSNISQFASGRYGLPQKIVSGMIYFTFRYLSLTRKGDQFCGVFERVGSR